MSPPLARFNPCPTCAAQLAEFGIGGGDFIAVTPSTLLVLCSLILSPSGRRSRAEQDAARELVANFLVAYDRATERSRAAARRYLDRVYGDAPESAAGDEA